ncbi:MAG: lysine--tRNA ligase [Nanoarchaeota archaeon]|nr:lysine--tRNA ligase [Nanoarchaeota archaeon]
MGREEEIVKERIKKIEELRKKKINPYPNKFDKKKSLVECSKSKSGSKVQTAGRLISKRDIGKIAFGKLLDFSGNMQVVFQDKKTPEKVFDFFKSYIDIGDFIGIEGKTFKTKTGEYSILVTKLELLSKSILPLPEKFHGLSDEEERLRKRYLDIMMNPEVKELFVKKYHFWKSVRDFLTKKGFMEVETPALETMPGGADARPFITHHNTFDIDVYLRISMGELWQKRLMVAGFEKIFELGRQFRNEGISSEHLQDYTQMEFYWAYANYEDGMKLVEEMYKYITKQTLGTLNFTSRGFKIDLSKPWKKIDYASEIKKQTGVDFFKSTAKQIEDKLTKLGIGFEPNLEKERLIDLLWKYCRKNIGGPAFLVNHPVEVSPLAKRNPKKPGVVEEFVIILAGSELGKGYSELNDPIDQENRFLRQQELRKAGDEEAQMHDKDFVEALKYGMPPTCGFGLSERLFAFLVDKPVRECQIFPLMKPQSEEK